MSWRREKLGLPEAAFIHDVVAAAYDAGGNLEDDKNLLEFAQKLLDLAGSNCKVPLSLLRDIRDSVKRGERTLEYDFVIAKVNEQE